MESICFIGCIHVMTQPVGGYLMTLLDRLHLPTFPDDLVQSRGACHMPHVSWAKNALVISQSQAKLAIHTHRM